MIILYNPVEVRNVDLKTEENIKEKLNSLYKRIQSRERKIKELKNRIELLEDTQFFKDLFECDYKCNYENDIEKLKYKIRVYEKDIDYHKNVISVLERDLKKDTLKVKEEIYRKKLEREEVDGRIEENKYKLMKYEKMKNIALYSTFFGLFWVHDINSKEEPYKRLVEIECSNRRSVVEKSFRGQYKTLTNYNRILPILNHEDKVLFNIRYIENHELDFIYGKRFFHGQKGDYKKILDYEYILW